MRSHSHQQGCFIRNGKDFVNSMGDKFKLRKLVSEKLPSQPINLSAIAINNVEFDFLIT
ncbi:hypothetical protein [Calothrix sp. NIES-2100]|uniref:hypothetical protein n=1 Tax=Calothrix sp. NIES-2100 TaxID=1954172 RepID=UPI0030D75A46